jgi:hypothetical protein
MCIGGGAALRCREEDLLNACGLGDAEPGALPRHRRFRGGGVDGGGGTVDHVAEKRSLRLIEAYYERLCV